MELRAVRAEAAEELRKAAVKVEERLTMELRAVKAEAAEELRKAAVKVEERLTSDQSLYRG